MSTWFNNWKIMTPRNSNLAPKKDLNSMKLKKRRSQEKKRRLNSNLSANWWRMSLEIRLRRLLFPTELMNHLVCWSLENMDGLPIWKESWKLRLSETPPWPHTWCPRRPWKSILRMLLSKNWERRPKLTKVTRLLRIWSGWCLRPHSSLQDSPLMKQAPLPTESTEWSN